MANAATSQLQQWIDQMNTGDERARQELLVHTSHRLGCIARRKLYGAVARLEQTDDIVHEFYVRVLETWPVFVEDPKLGQLKTTDDFFFRAARLMRIILVDLFRKHFGRSGQRSAPLPLDVALLDPASVTLDPECLNMWTEVHEAIEQLPEKLRQVVDLRWYHDLSHPEVASILGIAEVTSRARWAQARDELKRRFANSPFDWSLFN